MKVDGSESLVVRTCVHELLGQGFLLCVDRGGDDWEVNRSADPDAVLGALLVNSEERIIAVRDGEMVGWILFIYGNGADRLIGDLTVSLEPILPKTLALAR